VSEYAITHTHKEMDKDVDEREIGTYGHDYVCITMDTDVH